VAEESFTVESAEANRDIAAECVKAEKSALVLVARAEQCSQGLRNKLEKKKYHSDVIQTVLDRLTELNLVNDRRYAELWLKSRIAKGTKGPRMLLQLLRAKGIDNETAAAALEAALPPETEAALIRRCLAKADDTIFRKKSSDQKTAIKFFLKKEGFSADSINQYIEGQSLEEL